jgi:hypothetical protein
MYFYLTEQIQRKFIWELRRYWQYHPKYQDIVEHIQGKYSFRERPQYGIILKNSSGNLVTLAADNFVGHVQSYVQLAHVENYPGTSIEWVRENAKAIQENEGYFPAMPGIYYIELCDEHGKPSTEKFFVDPLLDVTDETVLYVSGNTYQLARGKFLPGTLKLYEMPGSIELVEGVNYTADPETGAIELIIPLETAKGEFLSADYRYPAETMGPYKVQERMGLIDAIPGVVLAFGQRIVPGDRLAVVVTESRDLTAMEFGGKWDLNIDFDITARSPNTQREILDQTATYLWGVARSRLSAEGIEMVSLSLGGESEEIYDDNGDDYFYTASFSVSVQTDWCLHVPLGATIRRILPGFEDGYGALAGLSDEEIAKVDVGLQPLESLGLRSPFDPFFVGKANRPGVLATFERII